MRRILARYWPAIAIALAVLLVLIVHHFADRADRSSSRESYPRSNYSRIEDGLFLGGILEEPPPGTRAVLNVCETRDPYEVEVYRWQPIADVVPAPSLDWLRQQTRFIDEQRRAGRQTFVHCRAGISRSCMVVTAYLMLRDGCSRDDALAFIRSKRPSALPNEAFMRLLLELEDSIRKPACQGRRTRKSTSGIT